MARGLKVDAQGIHIRFVGLTDQKITLDQKHVLGIIFPPMHLNSLLNTAKHFTKKVQIGHLGLRNFPQG